MRESPTVFCRQLAPLAIALAILTGTATAGEGLPAVRSRSSGAWSAPATWEGDKVPAAGQRVLIRAGHAVTYDVDSAAVLRVVHVAGTLDFARDRGTRLEVGLLVVSPGDAVSEDGASCHFAPQEPKTDGQLRPLPALYVGRPNQPIPAEHRAVIRLHHLEGMDPKTCPAIVACRGRMELHGSPLPHTWSKLSRPARVGDRQVWIADRPEGWRTGDRLVVTATHRREHKSHNPKRLISETELRTLAVSPDDASRKSAADGTPVRSVTTNGYSLVLTEPLEFAHEGGGDYAGEVANLSRNVIVESADPNGVRGHTLYHAGSAGSIRYAEFRHLGKKGILGRYSIHFHLVGDSMRGSDVVGVAIWDSHNRWITIHGTNYLVVRDCVGFQCLGHGFFLEDGTEVFNRLDHNLAVLAQDGGKLPEQLLAFDPNAGAGFWWANCHNSFTRNVAADCDGYGYRYDARRADGFDPVQPIQQVDGSRLQQDIRSLPFIKFEDNEAHAQRNFGINFRGMNRHDETKPWYNFVFAELAREAQEAQGSARHPFWLHRTKMWDCTWAYHGGAPGVFLDGLDVYDCQYGLYRPVIDRHAWRNLSLRKIQNRDLHMPITVGVPEGNSKDVREYFGAVVGFADELPPVSVITDIFSDGDRLIVRGVSSDSSDIRVVRVNGRAARPIRPDGSAWEALLPLPPSASAAEPIRVTAIAEDAHGHVEKNPHTVRWWAP